MPDMAHHREVLAELDRIPPEFMPAFLKVIRAFRESVALPSADESFEQGWREVASGQTRPIAELWEDLDAE